MKKKIVSAMLIIVMALTTALPIVTFASSNPSSWAAAEVNEAKSEGLVIDSVTRNYQANITREQFCEMVVKAYEKISGKNAGIGNMYFSDTSNVDILKAANLGIVTGYGNNVFAPNDLITREQIAAMLVRTIDKSVSGANVNVYNNNNFIDGDYISQWAMSSVNYAYDKGIMQGVGNNCIDPQANTTCEQAVLLVWRLIQKYVGHAQIAYLGTEHTKIEDEYDAKKLILKKSEELGISNVTDELEYIRCEQAMEATFYHFQQMYEDIPVYGRSVTVGVDSSGYAMVLSDNYMPVDADLSVGVQKDEISEIIAAYYDGEMTSYLIHGLTIYSLSDLHSELCWEVSVTTERDSELLFISTVDGEVVDSLATTYYDTVQGRGKDIDGEDCEFNTYTEDYKKYYMEDKEQSIKLYDANNGTLGNVHAFVDENNNLFLPDSDRECLVDEKGNAVTTIYKGENGKYILEDSEGNVISENAEHRWYLYIDKDFLTDIIKKEYWDNYKSDNIFASVSEITNNSTEWKNEKAVTVIDRISKLNDFYYEIFGRVGFDGRGGEVLAVINDSWKGADNAASYGYWNGSTLLQFSTSCILSNDLIGHEYRHSVTDSIKDGLIYESESGALNEAYSDIFGELFEDWMDNEELDNSCDWMHGFRNLTNPLEAQYPDWYQGAYWADTTDLDNDNGNVHKNSTVISHAAYLMTTGLDVDNSIEHLTNLQLAKLFHTTSYVLPSTCTFEEFSKRIYIIAHCMYKNDEITEKQLLCVARAFEYVGLPITEQSIWGRVVDNDGNCVDKATVNFFVNGVRISSVETDKYGDFSAKLPVGTYEIQINKDGYEPTTQGAKLGINEYFVLLDDIVLVKDINDEDKLLNAFIEQVVGYNSDYLYFLPDDYDGDGNLEAFGITGWGLGEEIYSNVNIWFVDIDGNCKLIKSNTYGLLEETLNVSNGKFLSWCVTAGGSGTQSILLGVKDGAFFEPVVSGKYAAFVGKGSDYMFSDDTDFTKLNCNYVAYRSYFKVGGGHMWEPIAYDYDEGTREFVLSPIY